MTLSPGNRVNAPHPRGGRMNGIIEAAETERCIVLLDDGTRIAVKTSLLVLLQEQTQALEEIREAVERLSQATRPSQVEVVLGLNLVIGIMIEELRQKNLIPPF